MLLARALPRRRGRGVGQAADDERLDADRRGDARPRLPARRRVKAVPILARTAGLLAHLAEEREQPIGFLMAAKAEEAIEYEPPSDARAGGRDAAVGGAARRRRRAYRASSPTCSSARPSTATSCAPPGSTPPRAAGGLADIAELPLTEKRELRATRHADEPDRRAPLRERRRDRPDLLDQRHTGTPSYIPLTAGDLENWVTGSARSYAASGVAAGQRIVSHLQRRAVRRGRGARRLRPHRPRRHIPVGTGNTERLMRAIELLEARGRRADAVLRRVPRRVGRRARLRPARVERRARARGGRARRRRAGLPREARGGLGRAGDRGDGHRRHRRRRCGASASSRTACTSARAASSTPS